MHSVAAARGGLDQDGVLDRPVTQDGRDRRTRSVVDIGRGIGRALGIVPQVASIESSLVSTGQFTLDQSTQVAVVGADLAVHTILDYTVRAPHI